VGLITALCGAALVITPLGTSLERTVGLDWLLKIRGATPEPSGVAIVGISGQSGPALGLLPKPHHWPRTIHARLIKRLKDKNPEVIVFDLDFRRAKSDEEDADFAAAIAEANRVVLFEWLEPRTVSVLTTAGSVGGSAWIEERQPPARALTVAARALGSFTLRKDGQATLEFWTFKPSTGGAPTTVAVALQLKALALPFYDDWLAILKEALKEARPSGIEDLPAHGGELTRPADLEQHMKKLRLMFQQDLSLRQRVEKKLENVSRLDAETRRLLSAIAALYAGPERYYLNLYGPPGTIRTIPYESFLIERAGTSAQTADLKNDVVFVGYADHNNPEQPDRYFTSFTGKDGVDLSGVEIMATAYANLLNQRTLRLADPLTAASIVLLFGLLAGALAYLLPAAVAVPSAIAFTGLYAGLIQWRFNAAALWLPLAIPALQLPLALLIGLMGQYLLERRKEKQVTRALRHYLPESLVLDLTERQIDPTTVNRVLFGTCLATDMSGFTSLGESKSPQQLALFLNEYFDALAAALKRHDVDVMEFRADMIMCAWTAPVRSPVLCQKAVDAAIELRRIIAGFAGAQGPLRFNARVGLQDGPVYVGHTGGGGHLVYSIQGHAANTAARLESLNKKLGTHILAAESVVTDCDGLLLRPLGLFRLCGKADLTSVVEICGRRDSARAEQVELCAQFAGGLAAFQKKEWLRAANTFEAIARRVPDGPSKFYLDISRKYAAGAPLFVDLAYVRLSEK
jgi:adenylate cyclase